jgi:anti-sigma factor RsiW
MKHCPNVRELSAYVDGELSETRRQRVEGHLSQCFHCAAALHELRHLRAMFATLPERQVGFDLAPLIRARLSATTIEGTPVRWLGWCIPDLMPLSLTISATVVAGIFIGALLTVPGAVTGLESQAVAMFDPVPPGGICVGHASCYNKGKL